MPVAFFYDSLCEHRAILETYKGFKRWESGSGQGGLCEEIRERPKGEPFFSEYEKKLPSDLLEMIGERMHEGERKVDEAAQVSGIRIGFLNTPE